jgi:hypothetical protein
MLGLGCPEPVVFERLYAFVQSVEANEKQSHVRIKQHALLP